MVQVYNREGKGYSIVARSSGSAENYRFVKYDFKNDCLDSLGGIYPAEFREFYNYTFEAATLASDVLKKLNYEVRIVSDDERIPGGMKTSDKENATIDDFVKGARHLIGV